MHAQHQEIDFLNHPVHGRSETIPVFYPGCHPARACARHLILAYTGRGQSKESDTKLQFKTPGHGTGGGSIRNGGRTLAAAPSSLGRAMRCPTLAGVTGDTPRHALLSAVSLMWLWLQLRATSLMRHVRLAFMTLI